MSSQNEPGLPQWPRVNRVDQTTIVVDGDWKDPEIRQSRGLKVTIIASILVYLIALYFVLQEEHNLATTLFLGVFGLLYYFFIVALTMGFVRALCNTLMFWKSQYFRFEIKRGSFEILSPLRAKRLFDLTKIDECTFRGASYKTKKKNWGLGYGDNICQIEFIYGSEWVKLIAIDNHSKRYGNAEQVSNDVVSSLQWALQKTHESKHRNISTTLDY